MKHFIKLLTVIFLVSSCSGTSEQGSNDEPNHSFSDYSQILEEFVSIINSEYLISQSNDESLYEMDKIENGLTKRISLTIRKNLTKQIKYKKDITGDYYQGEMNIYSNNVIPDEKHNTEVNINFYLPSNMEITLENILEHNKYDFRSNFIYFDERFGGARTGTYYESYFSTDKKTINGSGEILKMDGLHEGGYYLAEILNDTIEYSKLTRRSRRNGKYFKRNIVHTRDDYRDEVNKPVTFSGEIVKYVEYEGEFIEGVEIGLHKKRRDGILETEIIYEESREWVLHKEYWNSQNHLYIETEDGLWIKKWNHDAVSHVWSNQDELDIDVDLKGYKSYTPDLTLIKHRKGITIEGTDEKKYVHHGKYQEYSFFPIKPNSDIGRIKPTILANYSNGFIDGNIIINSNVYDESEEFNGVFDNGQFVRGVFKEYDSDYINYDGMVYVKKETIVDEGGVKWKEYDSSGKIVNEGFQKITPNNYFYKVRNGYGLDLDNKRYELIENP